MQFQKEFQFKPKLQSYCYWKPVISVMSEEVMQGGERVKEHTIDHACQ